MMENNKSKIYKTTDCSLKAELMESPQKQTQFLSITN